MKDKDRRAVQGAHYAIFSVSDAFGNQGEVKTRLQFWERQDGKWRGFVVWEEGRRDAESFNNFVRYE